MTNRMHQEDTRIVIDDEKVFTRTPNNSPRTILERMEQYVQESKDTRTFLRGYISSDTREFVSFTDEDSKILKRKLNKLD